MANAKLMQGKRGLVMGVANDHSIAWGIARTLSAHGAEIAFSYQGDAQAKRLKPLAASIGAKIVLPVDVENDDQLDTAFAAIKKDWGGLDFLVHSLAFSDREELKGRYVDTSRDNFTRTMSVSCYSFTAVARRAAALMGKNGAMLTMTYLGGTRVMPNYNVMGVAKAALEASVRYLAADLGHDGIRVNAISAGPMRTLAGAGVGDARMMMKWNRALAPLKKSIELDHVGGAALYLLSELGAGVTGEVHFVDAGFNVVGMPVPADMKIWNAVDTGDGEGKRHMRANTLRLALATTVFALVATSASAGWQDVASRADQQRLASLGDAKQKGLAEAHAGAGAGDASAIDSALGAESHAPSASEIVGSWRCRTIKLGGMTPYVVYSWFNCRISNRGGGLHFEKTSGSQRTNGFLYPGDGGFVYLGASSVTGEPPHAYSGNGASAGAGATPDDQIGILTAISTRHARLELPYPVLESTFDVIELKR